MLATVTPPGVSGTASGQQVASGTALRPFAAARITDNTPGYDAQTIGFDLSVSDAVTKLTVDDKGVTVRVAGASAVPVAPFIAGASGQTVAAGNGISPFNGVTISDSNAEPLVSATLTMSGGGTLIGAGLVAAGAGVWTLASASPAALTASLQKLALTASLRAGPDLARSTSKLDLADGAQVARDSQTTVTTMASLPGGSGSADFAITGQTTGQQASSAATPIADPCRASGPGGSFHAASKGDFASMSRGKRGRFQGKTVAWIASSRSRKGVGTIVSG